MIPDDIIEQVRDSADIVGLVGEAVELKRTGSDYRGACPFHGGTHRNFAVIPKKGRYYCFVCHESGDVFSWLMKRFGMDYPSAVREIARRVGITIPERAERAGPDPREPLYGAVAAAQDWFSRQLQEGPGGQAARDYLAGRDLSLETAAVLGLGFAPPGKEFLGAMETLGISADQLAKTGLTVRRDDGSVGARFRNRLLFPIHDLRGRAVGFGGRLLGPGEPKYLNSPETEIFQKGKLLYNLHQAKGAIRKADEVILVEGYFDVLRPSLAGLEHIIAPLGTGLTPDQGALLRRFAPAAILLYDSDQAGLRATFRTADELLRHGMRVRVATLPPGEDPDSLVRAGGLAALEPILRDALDVMERKIQLLDRRGWFTGVEHRRDALDRLLSTIRAASDPITRELYLSLAAERTGVSKDVLAREAAAGPAGRGRTTAGTAGPGSPSVPPRDDAPPPDGRERGAPAGRPKPRDRARNNPETQLLQAMLAAPEWIARAREEVAPPLFESARLREVFEAVVQAGDSEQIPSSLSEPAQLAWAKLKQMAAAASQLDIPSTYDRAVQILRARPEYRRMAAEPDPGEKRRQRAELQARYPEADRWYTWQLKGA